MTRKKRHNAMEIESKLEQADILSSEGRTQSEIAKAVVSVREDIESDESVVIQEWRPDSGGAAADVDDRKSCPL